MLCINKRLYWTDWRCRRKHYRPYRACWPEWPYRRYGSNRLHWCNGAHWTRRNRSHWSYRTHRSDRPYRRNWTNWSNWSKR